MFNEIKVNSGKVLPIVVTEVMYLELLFHVRIWSLDPGATFLRIHLIQVYLSLHQADHSVPPQECVKIVMNLFVNKGNAFMVNLLLKHKSSKSLTKETSSVIVITSHKALIIISAMFSPSYFVVIDLLPIKHYPITSQK